MLATTLNLAARIIRPSKRPITLANIAPTQAQADDLFALYAKIVAAWIEGIPGIVAEYERTIAEMTTDSAATTGGAIDSVAAEIQRLVIMLTPDLRRWALRVEAYQRRRWAQSVLSATDIDLNTVLTAGDVQETVETTINWNVALVRDVSDEIRRKISAAVFNGFTRRSPAADIAKEISEATGLGRARSRRIASHQTVNFGQRLNDARREQAGIDHWKWRSSHKVHFRPEHQARDGKIYTDKTAPADLPGMLPNCGCGSQAIVVFDA